MSILIAFVLVAICYLTSNGKVKQRASKIHFKGVKMFEHNQRMYASINDLKTHRNG